MYRDQDKVEYEIRYEAQKAQLEKQELEAVMSAMDTENVNLKKRNAVLLEEIQSLRE